MAELSQPFSLEPWQRKRLTLNQWRELIEVNEISLSRAIATATPELKRILKANGS